MASITDYVHPDVLVSAEWVQDHLNDPNVRIVESDEDVLLYNLWHIPGAVKVDWQGDLQDQIVRDYIGAQHFESLCARLGITKDTTVVFYGDNSNWWACYAFWAFQMFDHKDCRILNGGRKYWDQQGLPRTTEIPSYPATQYRVTGNNEAKIRAFRDDTLQHALAKLPLIDVRSFKEFTGEMLHMEGYPQEGSLRGGHIPGAKSVPWSRAVAADGRFLPAADLHKIYEEELQLKKDDNIIAYCRIGERSSLTWFVLKYLLGFSNVRNYDGSWTEWGNLVRVPIAKGTE